MPQPKPILIVYDGDCGFCKRCVDWIQSRSTHPIHATPYQKTNLAKLGISLEAAKSKVHLVTRSETRSGAFACVVALNACKIQWPLWVYTHVPLANIIMEMGYQLVAKNRRLASKLTSKFLR